eukprot:403358306
MNLQKQSTLKDSKQDLPQPSYTADELQTKATIAETIEIKFFACETRIRELLSSLVEPAISKSRISYDTSLFIQQEFQKMSTRIEKLELVTKKLTGLQKRVEETNKHVGVVESNINLTEIRLKDLIQQANYKIDSTLSHIHHQRDDNMKVHAKLDAFNINISKCYEDIFEFKDNMADLLTSFKIEILVNQEKILKDLLTLQEHKKSSVHDIGKTRDLIDSFDLKLEQYKNELTSKMEAFNPLEFNLMEKDYFFSEQEKTYLHIRSKCQELAAKIRNLEKYVDVVESMNDQKSEYNYKDIQSQYPIQDQSLR